jgi:hypothetical protein
MEQFHGSWHDAIYPESRGRTSEATKGEPDVERDGKYALGTFSQFLRIWEAEY